jgi:hypothetical protein
MSKLVKFELSRQGGAASCKCKVPYNHVLTTMFVGLNLRAEFVPDSMIGPRAMIRRSLGSEAQAETLIRGIRTWLAIHNVIIAWTASRRLKNYWFECGSAHFGGCTKTEETPVRDTKRLVRNETGLKLGARISLVALG